MEDPKEMNWVKAKMDKREAIMTERWVEAWEKDDIALSIDALSSLLSTCIRVDIEQRVGEPLKKRMGNTPITHSL